MNEQQSAEGRNKGNMSGWTPEKRREVARKGGLAAQAKGTAHQFTSEEAKAAGQKGGRRAAEKAAERRLREAAALTGK